MSFNLNEFAIKEVPRTVMVKHTENNLAKMVPKREMVKEHRVRLNAEEAALLTKEKKAEWSGMKVPVPAHPRRDGKVDPPYKFACIVEGRRFLCQEIPKVATK